MPDSRLQGCRRLVVLNLAGLEQLTDEPLFELSGNYDIVLDQHHAVSIFLIV